MAIRLNLLEHFPLFCQKLSHLLCAGIPLHTALQTIHDDTSTPLLKKKIGEFQSQLSNGHPFCASLTLLLPATMPFHFSSLHTPPHLPHFLEALSTYYTLKLSHVRFVLKQLAYPLLLITTLCFTLTILIHIVIPNFIGLQQELGVRPSFIFYHIWRLLSLVFSIPFLVCSLCIFTAVGWLFKKKFRLVFARIFFPFSSADLLWLIGLLLKSGISIGSLSKTLSLHPNHPFFIPFNRFIESMNRSGDFPRSFSEQFKLTLFQSELLKHAGKSQKMGPLLHQLSELIRQEEKNKIEKKLVLIQPILLGIITCSIISCFYLLMAPIFHSFQALQ